MDEISFGDKVGVRSLPETVELGVAGLKGSVYGVTTPSVTGVDVVGELKEDRALNVHFSDLGKAFWFAPHLLEFVDHGAGTEIEITGKKLIRSADGTWRAHDGRDGSWWKFWQKR